MWGFGDGSRSTYKSPTSVRMKNNHTNSFKNQHVERSSVFTGTHRYVDLFTSDK